MFETTPKSVDLTGHTHTKSKDTAKWTSFPVRDAITWNTEDWVIKCKTQHHFTWPTLVSRVLPHLNSQLIAP